MKILGYELDKEQEKIVKDKSKYLLVIAGAGSGKTLTILGKINYLVNNLHVDPKNILCISYTNLATNSLKSKIINNLKLDVDVLTFHKLALKIINKKVNIIDEYDLNEIIYNFFKQDILESKKHMQMVLFYFRKYNIFNIKKKYLIFYNNNYYKITMLSKEIKTFILLFKTNNYNLDYFVKLRKKCFNINKRIFLILCLNIYLRYQKYLSDNNLMDFDDLIINAINTSKTNLKYKYIIIDEYQDTSLIRFKLIDKIIKENNANLMAVGDDYQSIYRFSGSSISFFLNFKKIYPDANVLFINNTYRNSYELINIASGFILKNKMQIKKDLSSQKHNFKPIKIIYYSDKKTILSKTLDYILKKYNTKVMILGRNNFDINYYLNKDMNIINKKIIYKQIEYTYLTVHASKGLEEENIIIINLENSILGFPNKLKNIKFFNELLNINEKYPYAEERRLFYVAITRTKNNVFLLVNKNNKSKFVDEIITNFGKYIEFIKL